MVFTSILQSVIMPSVQPNVIRIYDSFGSIIVKIPYQDIVSVPPESLDAEISDGLISVKNSSTNKYIFYKASHAIIKGQSGDAVLAPTAAGTKSVLDTLFGDDNPSNLVNNTQLNNATAPISQILKTASATKKSLEFSTTGGKLDVKETEAKISKGFSEFKALDDRTTISVKSNTSGTAASAEAIEITGKTDSQDSNVDIKGQLKVSQPPLSRFSYTQPNQVEKVSVSGGANYLQLPSISSSGTLNSNVIQGSIVYGDAEDTINRGTRNYISLKGLSTGATVNITASIRTLLNQSALFICADSRNPSGATTHAITTVGANNFNISHSLDVTDFDDVKLYFAIDGNAVGSVTFYSIEVTIS